MGAPGELERRLRAQGLEPSSWANGPGERYPAHDHPYDKVIAVERGSIRFGLPSSAAAVDLEAGDRLDLPAGTAHDAVVGPDGVSCLEAHLPGGRSRRSGAGGWARGRRSRALLTLRNTSSGRLPAWQGRNPVAPTRRRW